MPKGTLAGRERSVFLLISRPRPNPRTAGMAPTLFALILQLKPSLTINFRRGSEPIGSRHLQMSLNERPVTDEEAWRRFRF